MTLSHILDRRAAVQVMLQMLGNQENNFARELKLCLIWKIFYIHEKKLQTSSRGLRLKASKLVKHSWQEKNNEEKLDKRFVSFNHTVEQQSELKPKKNKLFIRCTNMLI